MPFARALAVVLLLTAPVRAEDDEPKPTDKNEGAQAEAAAEKLVKKKLASDAKGGYEPKEDTGSSFNKKDSPGEKTLPTDPEELKKYLEKKKRGAQGAAESAAGGKLPPPESVESSESAEIRPLRPPTREERERSRALETDARERAATRPTGEVRAKRDRRVFGAINTAGQTWQKPGEDLPSSAASPSKPSSAASASAFKAKAASGDPSRPATPADLPLAAASGYKDSFAALGLRPAPAGAPAPAVHEDGSPAAPHELARLTALIASEPKAMMRRPDFFRAVSRRDFARVRDAAAAGAEAPALRHVGVSEDARDIVRSQSCDGLSGGCAPHAASASYRRGDYLPPEEIGMIARELGSASYSPHETAESAAESESSGSLFADFDADEQAAYDEWLIEERAAHAPKQSVFKDLGGMLASVGNAFGPSAATGKAEDHGGDSSSRMGTRPEHLTPAKSWPSPSTLQGSNAQGGKDMRVDAAAIPEMPPPPSRRALPWMLGAAVAVAAALLYRAKNRAG